MNGLPGVWPDIWPGTWQWGGARSGLAALALGGLAATGFEPLSWWPVTFVAMACLAALVANARTPRGAAGLGWLFGLAHFTVGNSWIATAFTYQAEMPAVLGWAAVPLLALYLALYPALAAFGARALCGRGLTAAFTLAFAGAWIVAELLRAWLFTGYAWNPLAMVLLGPFDRPGFAALAPWLGTYALSGLVVLISAGLALALMRRRQVAALAALALLALGMHLPVVPSGHGSLRFTLVQPGLEQEQVNDPAYFEANFVRLAELSTPLEAGHERLVLWPESGLADYLQPGYPQRYYERTTVGGDPEFARRRIARVIGPGSLLLTGGVGLEIADGQAVGAYNSVTAIDDEGTIRGVYAKAHLVPYGEYLPLRTLLEPVGLSRLVPGAIDFLPGPGPRTLDLDGYGRAAVQICYEIIFSGEVVGPGDRSGGRPDYIFNPSNDGWFGVAGPPQHLAQARMRAIEEGLPVLRATTSGISAVIDANGIVRDHLATGRAGRIDGFVPPALPPTLFARAGKLLTFAWAIAFIGLALIVLPRRQR